LSDFGSYVAVHRFDGQSLTSGDEKRIQAAARSLQFSRKDHIGPYDEFDFRFGYAQNESGSTGLSIGLTDYFIGDEEGNNGLDPDVIIAREEPVAGRFAEDLSEILDGDYRCTSYSGYW
jgi:hypothetical protein